jgi:16S rRNA (cytosine1402-N4)-methyltransferase
MLTLCWHTPVLAREVMEVLKPAQGKKYLDGTLGAGGHAQQILDLSAPTGQVLGLDWDETALALARERLKPYGNRLITRRANFRDARVILKELGWNQVDGALLDLGFSSQQLADPNKGLSFNADQRLDMRLDPDQTLSAYEVVNTFPVHRLQEIFRTYGEETHARKVALAIERRRRSGAIETTGQLAGLVERTLRLPRLKIHPATRVFQALRIFVNHELENLDAFLEDGYELLVAGGRMAIISFHSLEDRRVKNAFLRWSKDCLCPRWVVVCQCGWRRRSNLLNSKPIQPSHTEKQANPRSRSAKLRAIERL